ncbi:MAG: hypothetical protein LBS82_06265 [Spirochaetaceae bacterium]|jgi:hypothetical protein|nr:hypothetical protein [Spirochaetaceae bacterium]
MSSDWLAGKQEEQLGIANVWHKALLDSNPDNPAQTNAEAWGISKEKVDALGAGRLACAKLIEKRDSPDFATPIVKKECQRAFKDLTDQLRDLHRYFYTKEFPERLLAMLGQRPHKTSRPLKAKPTHYVAFEIIVHIQDHRIVVTYRIAGSASRSKKPYHGVEVRIWILPLDAPAPATADSSGWQSFTNTASPWQKTFGSEHVGKCLYIALRWVNPSTGKDGDEDAGKGPWSTIKNVVIP